MQITMPEFTADQVINFCRKIDRLDLTRYSEIVYDYGNMSTFEPFGMLVISSKLREIMEIYEESQHSDANYEHHGYGGTMGFFQSVYQEFGKKPGEALGSSNYIPMTSIDIIDLQKDKSHKFEHIGESIERHSARLSRVFSRGNKELNELLTYMIREIMRNIIEHSESQVIWFAGQGWPNKNEVEIAILDEGIGVEASLKKNLFYKDVITDNTRALRLCVLPGITKAFKTSGIDNGDVWNNSGFGLYMTSELCNKLGGNFIILSSNKALYYKDGEYNWKDSSFKGTAIRMRIRTDRITNLKNIKTELIKEGERKARKMKRIAVASASSASKSLSVSKLFDDELVGM